MVKAWCGGIAEQFRFQDPDVPDRGHDSRVDQQLGLGKKMANRAIVGLGVGGLDGFESMIRIRRAGETGSVVQPRRPVEARSAHHHRRV